MPFGGLQDELEEILVCSAKATFGIDFVAFPDAFSGFKLRLSGQIDISGFQRALIYQAIDCAAADRQRIATDDRGMVNGLSLKDQGSNLAVNQLYLIWRQVVASP